MGLEGLQVPKLARGPTVAIWLATDSDTSFTLEIPLPLLTHRCRRDRAPDQVQNPGAAQAAEGIQRFRTGWKGRKAPQRQDKSREQLQAAIYTAV